MAYITFIVLNENQAVRLNIGRSKYITDLTHLRRLLLHHFEFTYDDVECMDSHGNVLTTDYSLNGLTSIFIRRKGEKIEPLSVQMVEKIVPHINILTKGGDEYDFVSALAELIDNSIQNTILTSPRVIRIDFSRDDASVLIYDNGRGMDMSEIRNWATLGISDVPALFTTPSQISNARSMKQRRFITSDFSRYGVGSKRAIFNIGSKVLLTSKSAQSPFVSEVTLDKHRLHEEGEWKVNINVRSPLPEETEVSFTKVLITDVNRLYVEEYNSNFVRRKLAHIYHYYVHGCREDADEDGRYISDSDSDSEDLNGVGHAPPEVTIYLDGKNIAEGNDDLESLYLRYGKRRFTFSIPLQVESLIRDSSQEETRFMLNSIVYGELYYFPTIDGEETLPLPIEKELEGYSTSRASVYSLMDRNPGFEVFWNGRLLPRAHIPNLKFMSDARTLTIPSQCFSRLKGMLFVDSAFLVNATKLDLKRDGFPLYNDLLKFTNKKIRTRFIEWMNQCHKELDMEIRFTQLSSQRNSLDGRIYNYDTIEFRGEVLNVGDHVRLLPRLGIVGTITEIFKDVSFEFSNSCNLRVKDIIHGMEHVYPISSFQKKLSKEEYRQLKETQKRKVGYFIKIVDNLHAPDTMQQLPREAKAGFEFQLISVCIYNIDQRRTVVKDAHITMKVFYQQKNKRIELHCEVAISPVKGPVYVFVLQNQSFIPFRKAGTYIFEFSTNIQHIQPVSTKIEILPSTPEKLFFSSSNRRKITIGSDFELCLGFEDAFGNNVALPDFDIEKLSVKLRSSAQANLTLDISRMSFHFVKKKLYVDALRIASGTTTIESPTRFELIFSYPSLETASLECSLLPGEAVSLDLHPDSKQLCLKGTIPPIHALSLILLDASGNQTFHDTTCVLSSEAFPSDFTQTAEHMTSDNAFVFENIPICSGCKSNEITIVASATIHSKVLEREFLLKILKKRGDPSGAELIGNDRALLSVIHESIYQITIRGPSSYSLQDARLRVIDSFNYPIPTLEGKFEYNSTRGIIEKGIICLPTLTLPSHAGTVTSHDVQIFGTTDEELCRVQLNLEAIRELPSTMEIDDAPMTIQCNSPFKISVALLNEERCTIAQIMGHDMENAQLLESLLMQIVPTLEVLSPATSRWEALELLPVWKVTEITPSTERIHFSNIIVRGCPTSQTILLRVSDKSGILKPCKMEIEMLAGVVVEGRLNGLQHQEIEIENYGYLDKMFFTGHDVCGNIGRFNCDSQLDMEFSPAGLRCFCDDLDTASLSLTQRDDGTLSLPKMLLNGKVGETYRIQLSTNENGVELKSSVSVLIRPSNVPSRIELAGLPDSEEPLNIGSVIGPISALLIGEDGKPVNDRYPVLLSVHVNKTQEEREGRRGGESEFANDACEAGRYTFEDSTFTVQNTSQVVVKVSISFAESTHRLIQRLPALAVERVFDVNHGRPQKLSLLTNVNKVVSNSPSDSEEQLTLCSSLVVAIEDQFGNVCSSLSGGEVYLGIGPKDEAHPRINGVNFQKVKQGRALFDWPITLQPLSGEADRHYSLVARYDVLDLSHSVEFFYADMNEKQIKLSEINAIHHSLTKKREKLFMKVSALREEKRNATATVDAINARIGRLLELLRHDTLFQSLPESVQSMLRDITSVQSIDLSELEEILLVQQKILMRFQKEISERKPRPTVYGGELPLYLKRYSDIGRGRKDANIHGLLLDIATVNDLEVDVAICNYLKSNLYTIVVEDDDASQRITTALRGEDLKASANIVSMQTIHHIYPLPIKEIISNFNNPFSSCRGNLGFLIDYIEIKGHLDSELKKVFLSFLGSTILFDTERNAREAIRKLHTEGTKIKSNVITLDNACFRRNGVVTLEPNQRSAQAQGCQFGGLESSEGECLEKFLDNYSQLILLIREMGEAVQAEENACATFEVESNALERKIQEIDNEILNLKKEKALITSRIHNYEFETRSDTLKRKAEESPAMKNGKRPRIASPDLDEDY